MSKSNNALHSESRPFRIEFWPQRAWDWRIAFYLFLAGASGGLIFIELLLKELSIIDQRTADWGGWLGIVIASISLLILFSHLGPGVRWKAWNVFRNIRRSWISRGAFIVTVLMLLRILVMLPSLIDDLPWADGTNAATVIRIVVMLFALAFMTYSGIVLSSWNSIAFWNTPLLPILYISYSFLSGTAIIPIISIFTVGMDELNSIGIVLWPLILGLLLGSGFLLITYVYGMATSSVPAKQSVRILINGEKRWHFWIGVILIGLLIPILIVSLPTLGILSLQWVGTTLLIIACINILIGGYILRNLILACGLYGPPI
jgi:formate-dependent nitrite reductase membrane component NrfD